MDKMQELLLTVLALSEENYQGPISHAIPKRLMTTYRKALKSEHISKYGNNVYLDELGCCALAEYGYGYTVPFCKKA